MSRFLPTSKPEYQFEYWAKCNRNNLKYIWYFSLLTLVVFTLHLIYHLRLGDQVLSVQMMPYTLLYTFCIVYSLVNMLVLSRLRNRPALQPLANLIEIFFPFMMATIAVLLSIKATQNGLGITPFVAILLLLSFFLEGKYLLKLAMVGGAFLALVTLLFMVTTVEVYSATIAIAASSAIACLVIANITEHSRVQEFETLAKLTSKNRQLRLLSQQDHLTGLLNRRAIDRYLERELTRSERFDHPLSLLMIDIDDFKIINDQHGHILGDQVLQEVAHTIMLQVRDVDYVGRIGGDEFLVILIETGKESAMQIAKRMLLEIAKVTVSEERIKITISVGHAVSEGESHMALIEKADKALYDAKRAGKNKVRSKTAV